METVKEILDILKSNYNLQNIEGMARFGINSSNAFGVSMPLLNTISKETGKNHKLALKLWQTGFHEARILAALVDEPEKVTEKQMEEWSMDFDSWDVCDQCCMKLFDKTPFAYSKAKEWSSRNEEFVKRAGFALMASLAIHDKKENDNIFIPFLEIIKSKADDERNFVKKAVNWALRQIGKRSIYLNNQAVKTAEEILTQDSKSAKWIAKDALKELTDEKIITRIKR